MFKVQKFVHCIEKHQPDTVSEMVEYQIVFNCDYSDVSISKLSHKNQIESHYVYDSLYEPNFSQALARIKKRIKKCRIWHEKSSYGIKTA